MILLGLSSGLFGPLCPLLHILVVIVVCLLLCVLLFLVPFSACSERDAEEVGEGPTAGAEAPAYRAVADDVLLGTGCRSIDMHGRGGHCVFHGECWSDGDMRGDGPVGYLLTTLFKFPDMVL